MVKYRAKGAVRFCGRRVERPVWSTSHNEGSKKILVFYVYEILRRYSDEAHPLSQGQIASMVQREFGMSCDRKAVARNILALGEAGFDISAYEDNGKGYYLASRTFTDSEIRTLIDSVLASRYITGSFAKEMADKLAGMATAYFTKRARYITQASRWVHTDNPQVFLNIELLDEAIETGRKVRFTYNRYGLDKALHPRREAGYEVDPYQIIASNGRYYLVGNYDRHDCVTNFRIDLITGVEVLPVKSIPFEELPGKAHTMELADYARYALNMYDGQIITALLRLKGERIGDVIDWFGKDIEVTEQESSGFIRVKVRASDNGLRMWALQYGRIVEVLSPAALREQIRQDVTEIAQRYEQDKNKNT